MATQRLRPVPIGAAARPTYSLTDTQRRALEFLVQHPDATRGELGIALGLTSSGSVHRLIAALEERGYIRRLPKRARSIEVLHLPPPAPKRWTKEEGLAFARAWRIRMKPHFDAIFGPEPVRRRAA